jgi:hypothetical protein
MTELSDLPVTYVGGWAATKAKALYARDAVDLKPDELAPLVSIENIHDGLCRWPIESMTWCGRTCEQGSVYCTVHRERSGAKQRLNMNYFTQESRVMGRDRHHKLKRIEATNALDNEKE